MLSTPLWKGAKEEKGLKIPPINKLLTRFPVLLAQIIPESNWYKLKNEIRQILYLGMNIVDNKLVIITAPVIFCFDLPKDADKLEYETYSIINHNKLLAEHKTKKQI